MISNQLQKCSVFRRPGLCVTICYVSNGTIYEHTDNDSVKQTHQRSNSKIMYTCNDTYYNDNYLLIRLDGVLHCSLLTIANSLYTPRAPTCKYYTCTFCEKRVLNVYIGVFVVPLEYLNPISKNKRICPRSTFYSTCIFKMSSLIQKDSPNVSPKSSEFAKKEIVVKNPKLCLYQYVLTTVQLIFKKREK